MDVQERIAKLSPSQRALLDAKLAGTVASPNAASKPIPRRHEGERTPSFGQERLWFVEQVEGGMPLYNVSVALRLHGHLSTRAVESAVASIIRRHETLRTQYISDHGRLRLEIVEPGAVHATVRCVDLGAIPEVSRESDLNDVLIEEARTVFSLERDILLRAVLFRIAEDDHALQLTLHHIACDGWSIGVLYREFAAFYNESVTGVPAALPELPIAYSDYAQWQRDSLQGAELERLTSYWVNQLRGSPFTVELPTDRARPPLQTFVGRQRHFSFTREAHRALREFCRTADATPFMVLLASLQAVLHRYSGQQTVLVGSPIAARTRTETEDLIGFFANTLVFRADLDDDPSFNELVQRVKRTALDGYAHQEAPFEKVIAQLHPERDRSRSPLFQVMFALQNAPTHRLHLEGLTSTIQGIPRGTSKFDITVAVEENDSGLSAAIEYNSDLFDDVTIEMFCAHWCRFLQNAITHAGQRVDSNAMIGDAERRQLLHEWNATAAAYPSESCVHELFEAQVERTPDAVAVVFDDQHLTYAELNGRANQIAHRLRVLGVSPGTLVGVCVERSFAMLAALIGVLKVGAAYVPLDPNYPDERLRFMLQDTRTPVILTQPHLRAALNAAVSGPHIGSSVRLLDVDSGDVQTDPTETIARCGGVTPMSPAYVMYTSGSTGTPKGIVVPHCAVVRLVRGANYMRFSADEVFLGFAPVSFDASTLEIWGTLLNGAKLALCPPERLSPQELGRFIEQQGVTTLWLTSALFQKVVDTALPSLRGVRQLLAGGDVLSLPHVRRVLNELPHCRLINGYGPTENTTFTCCYTVPRDWPQDRAVPIGTPISNTTAYVLDRERQPVPVGVPGELFAGGDGVALGYLNRPELTAERFVEDPFAGRPGARLYRTGDRVRWLPDGTIEFLGRFDDQVKVRGFRVELGEIEAVLGAHPAVRQAAAVARRDGGSDARLIGYFSLRHPGTLNSVELRAYLRARVPEYMVPAELVELTELPINPSGKVDRVKLPVVYTVAQARDHTYVRPETTVEHELVQVWEGLLPRRPIGMHDDFFEIGGDSLLAARMLWEIEQLRGRKLPLSVLFENATLERLAALLEPTAEDNAAASDVVVLQKDGSDPPFAFVHGDLTGGGWYCRRMAPLLGSDVPLIVLPTLDVATVGEAPTIEAMAAAQLANLRTVQPTGPYRLGGFCAAGLVAFEMARQLAARGEEVERLVIIDSMAWSPQLRYAEPFLRVLTRGRSAQARLEHRAALLRSLGYYGGRLRDVRRMKNAERVRWAVRVLAGWVPVRRRADALASIEPTVPRASPGEPEALRGAQVRRIHARAAAAFIPRRYDGAVDVIWPLPGPSLQAATPTRGWERIARVVRVQTINAQHMDLITRDLPALAGAIRECLDAGRHV